MGPIENGTNRLFKKEFLTNRIDLGYLGLGLLANKFTDQENKGSVVLSKLR